MKSAWIALAITLTTLAGCSDAPAPPAEADDEATFEGFEAEVTDDTGLIRGVVVDATITPVAEATVTATCVGKSVKTNDNGGFVFADLDPGVCFVEARKPGFKPAQASAEVVAGEKQPPVLKIQLQHDPSGVPYHNAYSFQGYIECGTNIVALCGGVRDFTGLGDDTYSSLYDTENNITHLQSEMIWDNTQALGDSFSNLHRFATQDNYDGGFYDGSLTSGTGPSPLLVITNVDRYNEFNVGEDYEFLISIFAGTSETVPVAGVALSQDYQMFIHEFHGYLPPEGWRFSESIDVPGPQ